MTGPTTPDLAYNSPDAIGRIARFFPELQIVAHRGAWPRVTEIIGVAFRYANVTLVPDIEYLSTCWDALRRRREWRAFGPDRLRLMR
jgi:hypothetical protein